MRNMPGAELDQRQWPTVRAAPEFKARRFHTPFENAIYLLGTSATQPQIQAEANVEEAPTKRLRCRSLRALASFATVPKISGVLGFIILFIFGSILCPIWASGSLFVAGEFGDHLANPHFAATFKVEYRAAVSFSKKVEF